MSKIILTLLSLIAFDANAIETKARNAILVDYDTGEYLYAKDIEQQIPPASMSKLMTLYMIFSKLRDGSLSPEDEFSVSERAWRLGGAASGGSTMFLPVHSKVKVEDLIKGIIIQSGNDACIVAAENISGSEDDFAEEMNKKAKEIGLKNSNFANSTGLPDSNHYMSVEDLAKLSRILIKEFPEYYHYFSETSFVFNGIKQGNRNPLLYEMQGADGLKTGHTEEAGFCLTASAKNGKRRLIEVMAGMSSMKERGEESEKLMNWGFREFNNYTILKKGQVVATVPVWMGKQKSVDLIIAEDVVKTLPKNKVNDVILTVVYEKPVKAPVKKGDKLGVVKMNGIQILDLVAFDDVEKLSFFGRIARNLKHLLLGAN